MTIYYYELDDLFGNVSVPLQQLNALNDTTAVDAAKQDAAKCGYDLLIVYRENLDTEDGTPFVVVYEKE